MLALLGRGFSRGNDSDHASALPLTVAHNKDARPVTDTKHDEALLFLLVLFIKELPGVFVKEQALVQLYEVEKG